jgi:hypothetical protein
LRTLMVAIDAAREQEQAAQKPATEGGWQP